MGIDCSAGFRSRAPGIGSKRLGLLCRIAVPGVTYEGVVVLRSVPQIFFGMSRLATLLCRSVRPSLCNAVGSRCKSSPLHHEVCESSGVARVPTAIPVNLIGTSKTELQTFAHGMAPSRTSNSDGVTQIPANFCLRDPLFCKWFLI
jgi:hypothetical protein